MASDRLGLRVLPHLLSPGQEDYEARLRLSYDEGVPHVPPLLVILVLQESCNVKCVYCPYVTDAVHYETKYASTEQWVNMLDQLADFGVRHVRFSGGEPTLRRDLVKLVSHATSRGLQSAMVTNGLRLTRELGDALLDAGLGAMTISVDSLDPAAYERVRKSPFDKMLAALDVLEYMQSRPYHFWVGVNCVITRHNIGTIPDLVEKMSARTIPVQFMPVHSFASNENVIHSPDVASMSALVAKLVEQKRSGLLVNNSEQYMQGMVDFTETGRLPKNFECSAGYLQIYIDPDLTLRPCCVIAPVLSLKGRDAAEAWSAPEMQKVRRDIKNHNCPRCWLMYVDSWK